MQNKNNKLTQTNRRRGEHSTAVKNPNPIGKTSDRLNGRPMLIRDLVKASQTRDIVKSEVVQLGVAQLKLYGDRKRGIYADCAKAMRAFATVIAEHVNVVTDQAEISLRNASDMAGLTTQKEGGKPCISRASRLKDLMVLLGLLKADKSEQVYDGELGQWVDLYYEVTPLFYIAFGFTEERIKNAKNHRLGLLKNKALAAGLSKEEVGRMSIAHLKDLRRQEWRKKVFERRAKQKAKARDQRALRNKNRAEQRAVATQRVLKWIPKERLATITQPEFKDLVNREIAMMRQLSGMPAPPC